MSVTKLIAYAREIAGTEEQKAKVEELTAVLPEQFAALGIISKSCILKSVAAGYRFACRSERSPRVEDLDRPGDDADVSEIFATLNEWRSYTYIQMLFVAHDMELASSGLFHLRPITAAQPRLYLPQSLSHRIPDYGTFLVDETTGLWRSLFTLGEIKLPEEEQDEFLRPSIPKRVLV